ncbi:putative cytochrome p450 monooxygenase protein [Eutypa lata UCREL1]|uniref:Putative cytochrome p450 monooxygenase protein n=1 Tax=Eutypa lata (strain UCR-EL1) TaxID=1287681 RepID=M7SUI7_EUTLA|nr:putative cytochrome p450 monooxygenase protein [Eutypa lata UCREL1]
MLDIEGHDKMKAMLSPGYSGRETAGVEQDVDDQLKNLVDMIRRKYATDGRGGEFRPLDLAKVSGYFTLDVISRVALVRQYYAPDAKDKKNMLGSFVRHGLSQQECEVEALFMFVAGSDTTAAVIRVTLLYILSSPLVYHRLKHEIAEALREERVSSPIKQSEAKSLPYLQAVIYEGLRIRPVALGLMPKEVPPEGDTIHGKFIPGGTSIGMNPSGLLRSKELFGADADMFRPERFLEIDKEARTKMQRDVELTFGYGRWMCAGKPIAFLELNKVYFELFRAFDFQIVDPRNSMDSSSAMLFMDKDFYVRVIEASD